MTTIDTPGEPAVESGETADADLVLRTRSGDKEAFGQLWYRHYRSGITVARAVSPGHDPDDLVQEAYARIYQSILRGGGPTGSFRAYLFTSIRNTAAAWGRSGRETPFDVLDMVEDPSTSDEASEAALDRGLTHRAFRSLPTRWQEVLWYTEIEQMKPAEVAPLLGMKPTAVAQLAFRAREGLREAWIQAHLQSVADGSDCQWTIERLGAHARENLSRRDQRKVETHLAECARCTIVAAEAKAVSRRLALVLLPLVLGATGGAAYLASLQGGGVPAVALAAGQSALVPGAVIAQAPATGLVHAAGTSSAGGGSTAGGGSAAAGTAAGGTAAVGGSAAGGTTAVGGSAALAGTAASTGAGAAAVGTAATVAGAGSAFTGLSAFIGATTAAAVIVGSVATTAIVAPDVLSAPFVAVAAALIPDEAADAEAPVTDAATDATVDGVSAAPAVPEGVPSVAGASVTWEGTQPTVTVPVSGVAGATVEILINGAAKSATTLGADGTGATAIQPNYGHVTSDARLQFRYRAGDAVGEAVTMQLSDLIDIVATAAIMAAKPEVAAPEDPAAPTAPTAPTTSNGNANGQTNGNTGNGQSGGNTGDDGSDETNGNTGNGPTNGTTGNGQTKGQPADGEDAPPANGKGRSAAPGQNRSSGDAVPMTGDEPTAPETSSDSIGGGTIAETGESTGQITDVTDGSSRGSGGKSRADGNPNQPEGAAAGGRIIAATDPATGGEEPPA